MIISLTGFMGCGKSSVGKRLYELLSCKFVDLDSYIEDMANMKIPEIFSLYGEAGFREKEYDALSEIISEYKSGKKDGLTIISLGGGTLTTGKCREIVCTETKCIYLKAETDTLVRNLEKDYRKRPLISVSANSIPELRQRICTILKDRIRTYEACSSVTVETDGKTVDEIACDICGVITGSI